MRTVEQIRSEISSLEAELSTLSGEPLLIWTGRDGDIVDCPEGGATLTVEWAIQDYSYYCNWYPTTEAAKAALLAVARENNTTPSDDGLRVDLTSPGRHSSRAYVTRRASSIPEKLQAALDSDDESKYYWEIWDGENEERCNRGARFLRKLFSSRVCLPDREWRGEQTSSADIQLLGLYRTGEDKPHAYLKWRSGRGGTRSGGCTWNEITLNKV